MQATRTIRNTICRSQYRETWQQTLSLPKRIYLKVKPLSKQGDFTNFRSLRAKHMWSVNSRPGIACPFAHLIQITKAQFNKDRKLYYQKVNAVVSQSQENLGAFSHFLKLGQKNLKLGVYSDAPFATYNDNSFQHGHIIFLVDNINMCQPICEVRTNLKAVQDPSWEVK